MNSLSPNLCLSWLCVLAAWVSPLAAQPVRPAPKPVTPPVIVGPTDYVMGDAFPALKFEQPLGIVTAPGDKTRLFILEKTGRIQVITGLDSATPAKKLFLDLTHLPKATLDTSGECGVLGLAFPPDHAKSGRLFVY